MPPTSRIDLRSLLATLAFSIAALAASTAEFTFVVVVDVPYHLG